ncbi:alginate export family protein [Pseudomonas sp. JS3066]|jgi:alginate production protein|uniref:alginate export family protein n=1 Tax=unclassified Pseudomonas TaxID=196821 RepID=UPI00129DE326|nr:MULTISPECIES: alginate export family protein [unclassified Pseudomonas]MDH4653611.1 transcriptional regulator [Pseudomonas sp. BN606]MRK22042.1 transcriptional regulator [Pseudomonas sp. JG-B]WVK95819.1 alginate export family protein [Pseudomonas sp. JS3066]
MKLEQWIRVGLALPLIHGASAWAEAPDKPFGVDVKVTAQSEDDRDLGTRNGGDVSGIGIDVRPWLFFQRGDWSAYAMAQAVAATDTIETDTLQTADLEEDSGGGNNDRQADDSYLAMREFWIGYSGLTAYPGEEMRFGRQRLRNDDSLWRDTNIEALNWTFDTTLLRAHLGLAERFSEYRTDIDELAPEDEDRLHVYGDIASQWTPGHWVGLNVHYSHDDGDLRSPGEEVDELDKDTTGDLTWIGLQANSDAFNWRNEQTFNYWASVIWLDGDRDQLLTTSGPGGQPIATGKQSADVSAWGTDLGVRFRLDPNWQAGVAYARGSGGGDDGDENFQQTGLESNRNSFTGTRSRVHRFGEAFRGELSNLQVATLFGSWQLRDEYDASLVYHRFWRADGDQPVGDSGINAALTSDDKDIGQEVDLVLTKYFKEGLLPESMSQAIDEPSALVRFRGGLFFAGDAYDGSGVDSSMHRAFVDVIWRF